MLSFFQRDVLDEIWDLSESVSDGLPTYSCHLSSLDQFIVLKNERRFVNIRWIPVGMGERKIAKMVLIRNSRWPPCPYMVKTIQTTSSPELPGRLG